MARSLPPGGGWRRRVYPVRLMMLAARARRRGGRVCRLLAASSPGNERLHVRGGIDAHNERTWKSIAWRFRRTQRKGESGSGQWEQRGSDLRLPSKNCTYTFHAESVSAGRHFTLRDTLIACSLQILKKIFWSYHFSHGLFTYGFAFTRITQPCK